MSRKQHPEVVKPRVLRDPPVVRVRRQDMQEPIPPLGGVAEELAHIQDLLFACNPTDLDRGSRILRINCTS